MVALFAAVSLAYGAATWQGNPTGQPIRIEDLLSLRDIGGLSGGLHPSPDGSAIAFQMRQMDLPGNRYRIGWYVLEQSSGSKPKFVGDGGDFIAFVASDARINGHPADPYVRWSPDGLWIAYLRKSEDETQIWRSRRDGSTREQLTHCEADVMAFEWSADSSRIYYQRSQPRSASRLSEQQANDDGFRWDEDFRLGYRWLPRGTTEKDKTAWVVEVQNKVERRATSAEEHESQPKKLLPLTARPHARFAAQARTGNIASLDALDPGQQGGMAPLTVVASSPSATGSSERCKDPVCTGAIVSIAWHPRGNRVYFLKREGHADSRRALYEWRVGWPAARKMFVTDDWIADDFVVLEDRLVFLYETAVQSRRIASIRIKSAQIETLFDPNPEFHSLSHGKVEKIQWRDAYGNDTFGHLVYPAGYRRGQRYPLIIVQYRSHGFLFGGTGREYPVHVFAAHGFFVLSWDKPVFRDYEKSHSISEVTRYTYGENREQISPQSALDSLIDALTARELIDPARVGITGLSNGAQTARHALIHSNRFAAAAISQSVGEPAGYFFNSMNDRTALKEFAGLLPPGDDPESKAFWQKTSLALNVERLHAPILFHLSDSESSWAAQAIGALQDAGQPFEAYVYPNEYHIKNQPRHLAKSMERSVDWFDFWLRAAEDQVPEKQAQYARWRKLRELQNKMKLTK